MSALAGALHNAVVAAAVRIRDTGLRELVLRDERKRYAGEVTKIWRSGVWADGFGVERCLCCGLVTYPKQTKAVDECRCIRLAAAA